MNDGKIELSVRVQRGEFTTRVLGKESRSQTPHYAAQLRGGSPQHNALDFIVDRFCLLASRAQGLRMELLIMQCCCRPEYYHQYHPTALSGAIAECNSRLLTLVYYICTVDY
jgi:hypothetical protein